MTVLRSRDVLPRPPLPGTPTKRAPHKNPPRPPTTTPIGPRTPARADAPAAGVPRAVVAPEVGFTSPSPPAPRRSPRLAFRRPEAAQVESRGTAMRSGAEEGGEGRGRRGKRGRDASGAGESASSRSERERGGGVVGFDLNFPAVEFPSGSEGRKKREEGGKAVDLTVSSDSSSEESDAVRRRAEVIEVESDGDVDDMDVVANRGRRYSSSEKGKGILVEDDAPSARQGRFFKFLDRASSPAYGSEQHDNGEGDDTGQEREYSEEENGERRVLFDGEWLTLGDLGVGWVGKTEEFKAENLPANRRRESDRRKARELAPKFAFFKPEEEENSEGGDSSAASPEDDPADWPGPFSTAVKIINDREKRLESRRLNKVSAVSKLSELKIEWTPSGDRGRGCLKRPVPSLRDLSMRVLSENATEIESLEGIPSELRHQLSWSICKSRKMDGYVLNLFARGFPTEIRVPDCSWATEEQFERILDTANTDKLTVLQLDLCGRCLPDYILSSTLARSPDKLPFLTRISLKGAYRLSDDGLNSLALSAPLLSSINLAQCSLITSAGITSLVEKLSQVLRELYLDDCHIDVMSILPSLTNLKKLERLSVAGIESVTDKFVHGLVSVHGAGMKELVFAGCKQLTVKAVKEIGKNCMELHSLDLRDVVKLDDRALVHLANGCTSVRKLMLRHNSFSDKAIAALLEVSGGSLAELSLNNIREVSNFTAQAIAIRCSLSLRCLDLSFCRKITDEGLGLIVDSCSFLSILKVFGCRQITSSFLEGHSNSNVKIIGLGGSILQHLEMPGFT